MIIQRNATVKSNLWPLRIFSTIGRISSHSISSSRDEILSFQFGLQLLIQQLMTNQSCNMVKAILQIYMYILGILMANSFGYYKFPNSSMTKTENATAIIIIQSVIESTLEKANHRFQFREWDETFLSCTKNNNRAKDTKNAIFIALLEILYEKMLFLRATVDIKQLIHNKHRKCHCLGMNKAFAE